MAEKQLSAEVKETLLHTLKTRFQDNPHRHTALQWKAVHAKLQNNEAALWSLHRMEQTGGEPDVVGYDDDANAFIFCDCSPQSPAGRRSLCYDSDALASRKANKPKDSALNLARSMGIELLSEAQYRALQQLQEVDTKTSSWVLTPDAIRRRGGALFCDRRYDHVFVYHNGAESYYGARGFRGLLRV